jgi:hemoglobin
VRFTLATSAIFSKGVVRVRAWVWVIAYVGACGAATCFVHGGVVSAAPVTETAAPAPDAADGPDAAQAPSPAEREARGPTLYRRLGGAAGVTAIADTLIDRTVADPLTGPNFNGAKISRIKRLLAEQICDLSHGPCRYSGDSMKEVHAGHEISEAMFYRMVEILRTVLHERGVDLRSTNQLLRLLAPMKRDVVERPAAKPLPPAAP